MRYRRPRRRRRSRSAICPSAFSDRWLICTVLYILVSLVLTGLVSYKTLNVPAPVALGIDATGVSWGSLLVKIGAVFGLATVMLVMLLGQTRVFYSMSKDGLLVEVGFGDASEVPHAVDHHDRVRIFRGAVSRAAAHRQGSPIW